jgi:hypothetical protein
MTWQGVKMGLNKYRYVEYADDGCEVYECLSCKAQWEVRSFPTVYCGNCGVKFEGKHECRDRYTPRWDYDRFDGRYRWSVSDEREAYAAEAKEKVWVIQKRITLLESEWHWDYEDDAEPFPRVGEWKSEYQSDSPVWLHPARDIHAELARHRKYDNDLAEAEAYTQRKKKKQLRSHGYSDGWVRSDRVTVEKIEYRAVIKPRGEARGSVIYYRER